MIRNVDLFTIASAGVNASNSLLQTTSNNIANVNTEGYVRERTTLQDGLVGGVGNVTTERVINVFAQNQLRRDITRVGELESFQEKTAAIDDILANEANSLATALSDFFSALQTAADDPTNLASRDVVIARGESFLRRTDVLADYLNDREQELNLEFTSEVNRANTLIQRIGDLNQSILSSAGGNPDNAPSALYNERDQLINELADIVAIDVRDSSNGNGTVLVNLTSGESLVLDDGSFNVIELAGTTDLTFKELQLSTDFDGAKNNTAINLTENELGGTLGGLFRYRDEVLGAAQRDIGQLTVTFADALNTQNALGMDMDLQLGGDIFDIPEFEGLTFDGTSTALDATGRIEAGDGITFTDADIKVTVTAVTGGLPTEVSVEFLNGDGSPKVDETGSAVSFTGITVGTGFNSIPGGIEVDFQSASGYAVGNEFLFRPAKELATEITLATNRGEDLAFAAPIRVQPNLDNLGDAQVTGITVTNTTVDAALGVEASAFDGAGGIHDVAGSPDATVGAPAQILFTSASSYQVLDDAGNTIANVTGVTDYNNLLAQAETSGAGPAWPASFAALDDYPGYDLSIEGAPVAGDVFDISYNTNGINDNRNLLQMSDLQQDGLVQLSTNSNSQPRTFHESYSSLVGRIGEQASSAEISLDAANAMLEQSNTWFESTSGVNLDEEAANLIRYQQSYAAAARILTTAQELFNTILSSVR